MKPLILILPFLSALSACSRGGPGSAQAAQDFEAICRAQSEFIGSRELMKNVEPAELLTERNRRLAEMKLLTDAGLRAREGLLSAGAGSAKEKVEAAARAAGLTGWACPAL